MIYSAIVCLSFEKFTQNAPKLCSQKQIRTKVYHNNQLENDSYSKWQFTWKCYCFNFLFSYISWELLGLTFLWRLSQLELNILSAIEGMSAIWDVRYWEVSLYKKTRGKVRTYEVFCMVLLENKVDWFSEANLRSLENRKWKNSC